MSLADVNQSGVFLWLLVNSLEVGLVPRCRVGPGLKIGAPESNPDRTGRALMQAARTDQSRMQFGALTVELHVAADGPE
ncbi:hypothetical protein COCON_G00125830 [Conger conger]|uniref:Uncharacterized protein n=1 Tax=Conger conger TaxID=82655 RepID=A0A9Q1DDF9_CONCO|nr:hypothetical protein COCON_G00125830 [Conger conger]